MILLIIMRQLVIPAGVLFSLIFDKVLLSIDGSIGGLFLLVKGYFAYCSEHMICPDL